MTLRELIRGAGWLPTLLLAGTLFFIPAYSSAAGELLYSSVLSGGGGYGSAANSVMRGTIGQQTPAQAGQSSSSAYRMLPGFWYPVRYFDTVPPQTAIDSNPLLITSQPNAVFTFSSADPMVLVFECSWDSGAWEVCASPVNRTLVDGTHMFAVRAVDRGGNPDPVPASYSWTIDSAAPSTTADVNAGTYNTDKAVTLTCQDSAGHCSAIYYSLNGGQSYLMHSGVSIQLNLTANTSLWFYSEDTAGNQESAVNKNDYVIDKTAPVVLITAPANFATTNTVYEIAVSATDTGGTGVSTVEIQVVDGAYYLTNALGWTLTPQWLSATYNAPSSLWGLDTSVPKPWETGKTYTIRARATDNIGNTAAPATSQFTYYTGSSLSTSLSLYLTSYAISPLDTVYLQGSLTCLAGNGPSVAGRLISFTIADNLGNSVSLAPVLTDALGNYVAALSGLTSGRTYTLTAHYAGSVGQLLASASPDSQLGVGSKAGYAIIVVGSHPLDLLAGVPAHFKTAKNVYDSLIKRKFVPADIFFMSPDPGAAADKTGIDLLNPAHADIQAAIQGNGPSDSPPSQFDLLAKIKSSPAPVYVVMIDHGSPDMFYIGGESGTGIIAPADLDGWFSAFEAGIAGTSAASMKRIIILGSCYSGSFIQTLSQGKPDRIVISSAAPTEESYRGPEEPGGSSGEFFIDELFKELVKGSTLKKSFVAAADKTRAYTLTGGTLTNAPNAFGDHSVQHPLLDDSADGMGNNTLNSGTPDGKVADTITLGIGVTNAVSNPAEFIRVSDTLFLDAATGSASLFGTASDNNAVETPWFEVRYLGGPALASQGGFSQLTVPVMKVPMDWNPGLQQFEKTYDLFSDAGIYEVYYFTRNKNSSAHEVSVMKRSRVYKDTDTNRKPDPFDLVSPQDDALLSPVFILDWQDATDPDSSDQLTYSVFISQWPDFPSDQQHPLYVKEEIVNSMTVIGSAAQFSNGTYYWKVRAIDQFGKWRDSTSVRTFRISSANGLAPLVYGAIRSAVAPYASIAGARIDYTGGPAGGIETFADGSFLFSLAPGEATITVSGPCYASKVWTGFLSPADIDMSGQLAMSPDGSCSDTTPPETYMDSANSALGSIAQSGASRSSDVTLTFHAADNQQASCQSCAYECQLDGNGQQFVACQSPKTYNGLANGSHTFWVRAKDAAGNIDPTPAHWTWTVDSVAPATIANPPAGTYSSAQSVTLSCSDGATGTGCASTKWCLAATGGNCTPTALYTGVIAISSTQDLLVSSADGAGNVQAATRMAYVINIVPQRSFVVNTTGSGTVTIFASGQVNQVCSGSCNNSVSDGTQVSLTAHPGSGYYLSGWSGNCSGTSNPYFLTVNAAGKSCTAAFSPNTLTVSRSGNGSGTVTSSPAGINCGGTCAANYTFNQTVTLTAAASPGSAFTGWSGAGCSGTGQCLVPMTAAKGVTAAFSLTGYTLSVSKPGIGLVVSDAAGINCGYDCSETYAPATVVTLTASVTDVCSVFDGWSGACAGKQITCDLTMSLARAVVADFSTTMEAMLGSVLYPRFWPNAPGDFGSAYEQAVDGAVIKIRAIDVSGPLDITKVLTLSGGYTDNGCQFNAAGAMTSVLGSLTISGSGSLTVENVVIEP